MSLYELWLEARKKGILAPEWELAMNFLVWATKNGYRPKYGYKGNFTPENLLKAKPKIGIDLASGPDATAIGDKIIINEPLSAEALSKMKVAKLRELGYDLKGAIKKDDIIKAIMEAAK
jgi:hypothetical protein